MTFQPGQSGNPNGRAPGVPNKINGQLREAILEALERKGGVKYLEKLAEKHPPVFGALLAKILPTQINATVSAIDRMSLEERRMMAAAIDALRQLTSQRPANEPVGPIIDVPGDSAEAAPTLPASDANGD